MATVTLQIVGHESRSERCRCGATGRLYTVAGVRRCWGCAMAIIDTSIPADWELVERERRIKARNDERDNQPARIYGEF